MFLRGFFDLNYSRGADKSVVVGYVIQNYNRTQLDQAALFSITAKLSLQLSGPTNSHLNLVYQLFQTQQVAKAISYRAQIVAQTILDVKF